MAKFQRPTGTRDLYPEDVLRRRYLLGAWRDASIRHGFEEIEGPTFEHLDLYTVKSGEGIVSELFSFRRSGGEKDYALRPEFTPTLARMYAEKAATLAKPTRWFTAGPYFRAERPQRGRLREFLQWNCDVMGDDAAGSDAEIVAVIVGMLGSVGLGPDVVTVRFNDRRRVQADLLASGVKEADIEKAFALLDKRGKLDEKVFAEQARAIGLDAAKFDAAGEDTAEGDVVSALFSAMADRLPQAWVKRDAGIVRGLAYYTGMVFEVIADGERAVAGGGRYDNLVELFGGPKTPAVGFGMGDVVLSLLLQDKGLMPEGAALADAVSRRPASARPDVFVISADEEQGDPLVLPLLSAIRRGIEREGFDGKPWDGDRYSVPPMHARTSDKSTRNLKKLLADAERQKARFAAIVHREEVVQLKDLDTREDLGDFHASPQHATPDKPFVGAEIARRLGY